MKSLKAFKYFYKGQDILVLAISKKVALKKLRMEVFPGLSINKKDLIRLRGNKEDTAVLFLEDEKVPESFTQAAAHAAENEAIDID